MVVRLLCTLAQVTLLLPVAHLTHRVVGILIRDDGNLFGSSECELAACTFVLVPD